MAAPQHHSRLRAVRSGRSYAHRRRASRRRLGYGRLAGRVAFPRGLHRAAVHGLLGRSTRLAGQSLHHRQHHYRLQSHSRCGNPFPSRTTSPTPRTAGRPPAMTTPRRRAHRRRPPQPRGRTIRTSPPSAQYSSPVCFSHRAPRGAVTTGFGRGIAPGARQQRSPAWQRRSSLAGFSSPPTPLPIATSSRRSWHRR